MTMKKILIPLLTIIILFYHSQVYAIYLSPSELKLGINTSAQLKVLSDNNSSSVKWSSSDSNIVSVSDGRVVAKNIGKAFITATDTNDGSKTICIVEVINNYIPITSIKMNSYKETILLNETKSLQVIISPSNASNQNLVYYTSNPDIVSITPKGEITGKKVGISYITITAPGTNINISMSVSVSDKIPLTSISLPSSITINELSTYTLTPTYTPSNATDKKITWKSSDESIATVSSNGLVTAKKPGTAEIRVISNDGGHVATTKITVKAISKELKSISLNKTSLTLEVGSEETLTVSYNPTYAENKKITWESSDKSIATVSSDGLITAKKPGTVTIKATSLEGSKEATCELTVISPPIESIKFEEEAKTIYVGDKTTLKTISTPENTSINNPIWTSSDESVATISAGIITAVSPGTTIITISNEDGTITATTTITVLEKPKEPLSIKVKGYDLSFNPNKKDYTLKINDDTSLNFDINVDSDKIIINGNNNLKNGSIITITINDETTETYIINIKKKENYTTYFIGIISFFLLLNIIRLLLKNKKKKAH